MKSSPQDEVFSRENPCSVLSLSGRQRKDQRKRSAASSSPPGPVPPRRLLQAFGAALVGIHLWRMAGPSSSPPVAAEPSHMLFAVFLFCMCFVLCPIGYSNMAVGVRQAWPLIGFSIGDSALFTKCKFVTFPLVGGHARCTISSFFSSTFYETFTRAYCRHNKCGGTAKRRQCCPCVPIYACEWHARSHAYAGAPRCTPCA